MENQTIQEGKTMAIISYITWIGTIVAFAMNNDKKNSFASFHIRQTIGLSLLSLANAFILGQIIGGIATWAISVSLFILWIIGLIGAAQGEEKKVPFLGDLFQEWFKSIA